MRDKGDEVTFFTTHANANSQSEHVPGRWFGERVLSLRSQVKKSKFDTILALGPYWNLLAIISTRLLRHPPAVVISGRTMERAARRVRNNKWIEIFLAKFWYRRADGYIAISHPTAAEAEAMFGINADRMWVIPNPAIAKITSTLPRSSSQTSAISADVTLEIAVPGRLTSSKRPSLAVAVAQHCREITGRETRVHFFGSGKAEASLRASTSPGIEIVFHGWIERWFEVAPTNAIVLVTSQLEGFANVLVESAAAGFPSVASSRALGVCDAIIPGLTGQLAVSDSIEDYSRAVLAAEAIKPDERILPWLHRFSAESSGMLLREALVEAKSSASRQASRS
ncbi:glycosyltransferase family 4 protein [Leucobacter denitrificans]|uniref:D-inositol 3-phosphate glycosyltransferase n=1 Tax=Leucobacter denitrificans TaxID=683042 RepID=A0A7G9S793_9MICO|nr:glycosyltransferase family 4 protein [Leucobacter denitrificans]